MMIGPTSFVNMILSGKSYEAAKREVRNLWREINRLKKVIEEHPDSDEMMICPMPGVKISTYRDYLDAAKEYFELQGWEYELSKEEIADKEFNERLKDVQSIEIDYGGYFGRSETRTITFDGNKINTDRDILGSVQSLRELNRKFYKGITKDMLLELLAELHIGEWKKVYEDHCVEDGTQWTVTFRYTDGKKKKYAGSNRFPYNFYGFLDVMQIEPRE